MNKELFVPSNKELIEKILKESQARDEITDKSILDKDFLKPERILNIITNYQNKTDLAKKLIIEMPLFYDDAKIWWSWDFIKKRWVKVDEVDILNIANSCSGANVINNKERNEILNALKQESRKKKPKPLKDTWLQFNNEIVDIKTGERFKATPKYFLTNPIPWNLGRNDKTPTFDKIFKEWVGEKYIKTLYEIIAYCLIPDYPIHRLFCLNGSGLNGKGCFLRIIRKFIGSYNVTSTELDTLLGSRFEITKLHKKLVCLMGETNFNQLSKTSILKKLTGGDLIGFEYKNKLPFDEKNYAKIIIATNSLPTTSDKTLGFYRRWFILDFKNRFSEKIDILETIPEQEYENLATKSIGILISLLEKREFHEEGTVEERIKRYEDRSDYLQNFLDEFTIRDINGYISKADFYKKFISWCKERQHRILAENSVGIKMKSKGIESTRKYAEWLYDGKGGQMRIWEGVKWKE